jgi:outer membrane immunogenic protein
MRTQAPRIVEGFALLLVVSALPAAADGPLPTDPYRYLPPPVFEYDWSGIYIGSHVGAATAAWDRRLSPLEEIRQHAYSAAGGVQLGVQKQWSSLLLGVEVSYTWADLGASSNSAIFPGVARTHDLNELLMLAGRVGVTWQSYLAYTKVGYAGADIGFRSTGPSGLLTSASAWEQGWLVGLGIEYGIRPDITIGVEYDYIHLNVGTLEQLATPLGVVGIGSGSVEVQSVLARVNYKFAPGWLEWAPLR